MKISIVIAEGEKQIMMTPETEHERQALKFIAPEDKLTVACQWGTFDDEPSHFGYNTDKCKGGYYRRFAEKDSLMFVISEKKNHDQ
jgi:hypothetical protein